MAPIKGIVAFGALWILAAVFTPACSSENEDGTETEGAATACDPQGSCAASTEHASVPEWERCAKDSDCVAVPKGGCCPLGWKVAVNKGKVSQYQAQFAGLVCGEFCPSIMISDGRQALCNHDKGLCEMVEIREIACHGGGPNPHECPSGHTCQGAGSSSGLPGHCVSDVARPDDGCGGCPTGQWCTFCFGAMTCIPVGAKC